MTTLAQRASLALVVALLVARPLLPGEDAALLIPISDWSGPLLVFLWLVALALWAIGQLGPEGAPWRAAWALVGLAGVVAMYFLSAGLAASYRRPAWLVSWEWAALAVVLFLTLQAGPQRRLLLAVALATGVTVASYGLYQEVIEFPVLRAQLLRRPGQIDQGLATMGLEASAEMRDSLRERVLFGHVFATFGHPNSFAGYLLLLLPLALGAALVRGRDERSPPGPVEGWGLGGVLLLFAATLWFSHSRGGLLAGGLVAAGALGWWYRRELNRRWAWAAVGAGLVLAAAAAWGLRGAMPGKSPRAVQVRWEYWTATAAMIGDYPWLGVGPGNFARHYPSYLGLVPEATERIRDPHQFALEVWASAGPVALAALLFALGAFAGGALRSLRAGSNGKGEEAPEGPVGLFYVGGGMGLLLVIVLTPDLNPLRLGVYVLSWFAAFWLFARALPSGDWVRAASLAGVAGLLLHLLVSGGIGSPALAQPLWAVVGLGLAGRPGRAWAPSRPARLVVAALAIAAAGAYLHTALVPVALSHYHLARAAELKERGPRDRRFHEIADHLRAACAAAPGDSRVWAEWARWQWQEGEGSWRERGRLARAALDEARRLDPWGTTLVSSCLQVELYLARQAEREREKQPRAAGEQEREEHLARARQWLDELVRLYPPGKAPAHYLMANALAGWKDARARDHAQQAWQAHQEATSPVYRLSPRQLEQVKRWRGP